MKIGIDLGFGFVKVVWEGGHLKFPTWIAFYTPTSLSQITPISLDTDYVVGEYAKYEKNKIEITTIEELKKYAPVLVHGAFYHIFKKDYPKAVSNKEFELVVGIAPKFKNYKREIEERIKNTIPQVKHVEVMPQGYGAFVDIMTSDPEKVLNKDVLIIDIGFNTLDYLLMSREGEKIKGDTIEKIGIVTAVEIFRSLIPETYSHIANYSTSRLIEIFEKGIFNYQGRELNFVPFKTKAIERYSDLILSRLKDEIGNLVEEIDSIILVGGGAYYVNLNLPVFIPEEPEFSNARGFYKSLVEEL